MKYSARNKNIMMLSLVIFVLIFLFGCAEGLKSENKDSSFDKWTTLAEKSQGHSPSAEPKKISITAKQASVPVADTAAKKLPADRINLTMRQAELKAVLRAMAKSVNLNLLVKNELKGEINVDFRGVPWDSAFTGLLRTYNLSYVWEGNVLRVLNSEDVKLDLERKQQLRDTQWVETLLDPVVVNINYADTKKLAETIQELLTKDKDGKPRGSIKVDEHTNSLVISALRDDLTKIMPIIEKLDKPTPQILIKANIVETTKGVARDLGIMWGGLASTTLRGNENLLVRSGGTRTTTSSDLNPTGNAIGIAGRGLGVVFPAANISDKAASSLGLVFGSLSGGNFLEVQLQALQQDNKLNILSSPSITTLDNQEAFTENGERVPFVTLQTSQGSTPTQTTQFEDAMLRLQIKPHVIDGKNLKMEITVKKDEVDMTRKSSLGDPYIIKKQTKTILIVEDGETIVISGLTKQTKSNAAYGVPWLKDLPVLGWAFKSDSKSDKMEEVLIFITPHILPAVTNK